MGILSLLVFLIGPILIVSGAPTVISIKNDFEGSGIIASGISLSATFDFWPNNKVDYGNSSWIHSGLFNLDLQNPNLILMAKALLGDPQKGKNSFLRIGGTLADHIVYKTTETLNPSEPEPCVDIYVNSTNRGGFSGGCLNLTRWKQIHSFARTANLRIIFGLNALYGGREYNDNTPWDPSNSEAFISACASLGYNRLTSLFGFELGNELAGKGILGNIYYQEYVNMYTILNKLIIKYYPDESSRPYLIGPDAVSGSDPDFLTNFLKGLNQNNVTLYAFTYHNYMAAGSDSKIDRNFVNPNWLKNNTNFVNTMHNAIVNFPNVQLWMGETGGAYNSGRNTITNAFEGSFWYLFEIGRMSVTNHSNHIRQSLIGGNYGLSQLTQDASAPTEDIILPNPDFFSAYLFQTLVSDQPALSVNVTNDNFVRAFAFCTRNNKGVTVLILNFNSTNNATIQFEFEGSQTSSLPRNEFILTAKTLQSNIIKLNGVDLVLKNGELPSIEGEYVSEGPETLLLKPLSIAFIQFDQVVTPQQCL